MNTAVATSTSKIRVKCVDADVTWSSVQNDWHPTVGEVYEAVRYNRDYFYIFQDGVARGAWHCYRFAALN